jgi:hypothetical protein
MKTAITNTTSGGGTFESSEDMPDTTLLESRLC